MEIIPRLHIDLPNALAGFVLGIIGGYFVSWQFLWDTQRFTVHKLRRKYAHLAGTYVNHRVNDDGNGEVRTGGTIRLTFQKDGSFKSEGLHSTGELDWEGTVKMSLEWDNEGIGKYRYPSKPEYGTQQITVLPGSESLRVVGQDASLPGSERFQFVHHWIRKRN
jgi:hypothetical protein